MDQSVISVLCLFIFLKAWRTKRQFCFDIYQECIIEKKEFYYIEKILMMVLPIMIMAMNFMLVVNVYVIRLWLVLLVLLDIALQYFAKQCGWLNIDKHQKPSWMLGVWIIFMVIIFFTIKT